MAPVIPIVPSKSIFGSMKEYVADPIGFIGKHQQEFGDIFQFRLAHRKLTVICNPAEVQHILQTNHRNYIKSLAYRKLQLLLGQGLFTSEGEFWLRQRRLAQPAFHKEQIAGYARIISVLTQEMIERWKAHDSLSINTEMTHLTLRIISKTLLGIDIQEQGGTIEEHLPPALKFMIKRITTAFSTPLFLPTQKNRQFKKSVEVLNNLIAGLIAERRALETEKDDLLSKLITAVDGESGQGMTDQQLRDEVMTFFLAGHETTAVTAIWTIYLLDKNREVLQKVRDEITSQAEDDFVNLPYLEMVIKESMRLYSPVWILSREAKGEDKLSGYTIGKGDSVIFSPFLIHRDKRFWQNPEVFYPERFLKEPERYSYFPFGGGPRLCIGNNFAMLELKIILAAIIRNFDFHVTGDKAPGYDFSLTLRPDQELTIKLKPLGVSAQHHIAAK